MAQISRRHLLAGSLAAPALWGRNKIDHSRISAITDEIARSPEAAIAFAQQYGLKNLELRDVPGKRGSNYFIAIEDSELKAAAKQFADAGIKISFLNANLLKFGLPGTEPLRRTPEAADAREKRIARAQPVGGRVEFRADHHHRGQSRRWGGGEPGRGQVDEFPTVIETRCVRIDVDRDREHRRVEGDRAVGADPAR